MATDSLYPSEAEHRETAFANRVLKAFVEYEGDALFDQVLAVVQEEMDSRHGVFGYIPQPGHLLCPSLSKMLDACEIEGKCIHYPPEKWKGLWARALREKRSLYTNAAPPVPPGHPIIHNNLATPILFQSKVIGLLNIANKDGGYTDADCDTLDALAARVAPVLYAWIQRKLREDERQHAEHVHGLSVQFLSLINTSTGLAALLAAATDFFREQSGCEAVGVRLQQGDDYPYYETRGFPKEFVLTENSLCTRDPHGQIQRDAVGNPVLACMCGNVICGRFDPTKPFFSPAGSFWTNSTTQLLASTTEADRQARTRNHCNGQGYESVALIPLHSGCERLGLLQLNDKRPGRFTPELVAFWERLSGHLSVAIAKARTEEALHRYSTMLAGDLDAMTRLQKLGALSVQEGNLEPVLTEIVDAAIAISGADFGNIQLLDPASGHLQIAAQRGFPRWWLEFWNSVPKGKGACGTALEGGERVIVEDVQQSPIFVGTPALDIQRKAGVRAVQSTPLVGRSGKPVGMFSTHYRTPCRPDDRALRLLDLLARQAADIIEQAQAEDALRQLNETLEQQVAERTSVLDHTVEVLQEEISQRVRVENELKLANEQLAQRADQLRRLAGELTAVEQAERKRLSRILHDGLQQHLASAKMQLEGLAEQIKNEDQKQTADEIEKIIGDAVRMSRSLSGELSPPILHEGGLSEGLEWLTRWMREKHRFSVDLSLGAVPQLHEDVKMLIFESVRELLFNALKHSQASKAQVRLKLVGGGEMRVTVSDEGVGFDPCRLLPAGDGGGFGLFSIRERIGLLGGRLKIDSAPGRGSRVALTVPHGHADAAPFLVDDGVCTRVILPPRGAAEDQETTIRVLLVDDHALFRNGIARLLKNEPGLEVVGEAKDGQEAIEFTQELKPDVILMDISMPRLNGIEATRVIHERHPEVCIIGLSMYDDPEKALAMRAAGATDYRTKGCAAAELVAAIRAGLQTRKPSPE